MEACKPGLHAVGRGQECVRTRFSHHSVFDLVQKFLDQHFRRVAGADSWARSRR
jgi:hypothetical protein